MDSAIDATGAERGFIMLANAKGELEFKIARARGKVTLSGQSFATSQKIPQQVFADRPGAHRRRPARRRFRRAASRHGRAGHPPRPVHAVAGRPVPRAIERRRRSAADRRAVPRQPREGAVDVAAPRATRWKRLRAKPRRPSKARACIAKRRKRRGSSASCSSPPKSSARCCPRRCSRAPHFDVAASSIPCRSIGGDFFDYFNLAGRTVLRSRSATLRERARPRRC